MAIPLYMDVHVPQAITEQLRRRGIDVLTAFEDRTTELPDAICWFDSSQLIIIFKFIGFTCNTKL
jgi:hypothetical protein